MDGFWDKVPGEYHPWVLAGCVAFLALMLAVTVCCGRTSGRRG